MLLMAGRGFFDGIRDALSVSMEKKRLRREALEDPEEWDSGDEDYAEEERRRRAAAHRRHVRERRELAQRREEEEQRRQEEREQAREERRRCKEEEEQRRRRAEEQIEDERILHSSSTGKLRFRSDLGDAAIPPSHRLDDLHEITLLATEGEQVQGTELLPATADLQAYERDAADSLREIRPEPAYTENYDGYVPEGYEGQDYVDPAYGEETYDENAALPPAEENAPDVPKVQRSDSRIDGSYEEYVGEMIRPDAVLEGKKEELPAADPAPSAEENKPDKPEDPEKKEKKEAKPAEGTAKPAGPAKKKPYEKPSTSLLKEGKKGAKGDSDEQLRDTALLLQQTLRSFNVTATVEEICQGPSVTRFELSLGEGVKVNKIVGLADDLKLNLAAEEIRIEAPIPGKAAVGIEIPNRERIPVTLKELVESPEFKKADSRLAFVVGKDISGHVIIGDIAKMPHLLVAGTTGSGKSVFTNSIIQSILFHSTPEEVKLILIDPKVVEFSVYNGIPHLLMPVVTEARKANQALAWAVAEMTKRYGVFAKSDVRGIQAYNELVEAGKITEEDGSPAERMPQIVIVVDELADLMMVAGKEVEDSICRLAQMARAAGIHMIIATQRPSVDVITGLIKANIPSRVGLKCGSGTDSRIILDTLGAEKLLGLGDMLYSPAGFNKPLRVQGAFVSDEEVRKVTEFLKAQAAETVYDQRVLDEVSRQNVSQEGDGGDEASSPGDDLDEYFDKACRFVVEKEKASSGMLQRIFKVGYNRAARIVDQMEANGVVGPEEGTKPRKVLMNAEQLEEFLRKRKAE
ncbi:MAG: DNA translocase FtsK [Lachnospiraceae bacterium]|nr:DNA translocase FtsK [Lachnospiraceae bacterium]